MLFGVRGRLYPIVSVWLYVTVEMSVRVSSKIQNRGERFGVSGRSWAALTDRSSVTGAGRATPAHWTRVAIFVGDTPFEWYMPVGIICVRVYKSPTLQLAIVSHEFNLAV